MFKYCRFYELEDGKRLWLCDAREDMTVDKSRAGIFTEADWDDWAAYADLHIEWCAEDEQLKMSGSPMLPGFEIVA